MRYAEVIGDPIAQSKSPLIHRYWLKQLDLDGDYRRTQVRSDNLADYLYEKRDDPPWLGCNVTIPHKEHAARLVDQLDPAAEAIGAVNCVIPRDGGLFGTNTDVDGIAVALSGSPLGSRKAVVIGSGGAARAAVAYLAGRALANITILARDPSKAEALRSLARRTPFDVAPLGYARSAVEGASLIANATQMGMTGCDEMPDGLLADIATAASGATLFDMIYNPPETPFLAMGRHRGARVVDGLTMLIGQAARAFELFFGASPPEPDAALRDLLTAAPEE